MNTELSVEDEAFLGRMRKHASHQPPIKHLLDIVDRQRAVIAELLTPPPIVEPTPPLVPVVTPPTQAPEPEDDDDMPMPTAVRQAAPASPRMREGVEAYLLDEVKQLRSYCGGNYRRLLALEAWKVSVSNATPQQRQTAATALAEPPASRTLAALPPLPLDDPLRIRLVEWRYSAAVAEMHTRGWKKALPYLVFNDETLEAIATKRPVSIADLRGCRGIGETRAARWGSQILKVVNEPVEVKKPAAVPLVASRPRSFLREVDDDEQDDPL